MFVFLFTIYMDSQQDNTRLMLRLYDSIWLLKYCTFILLILFLTNIILHVRDNKRHKRENIQLIQELNTLKAKLYDLQEAKKSEVPNPQKPA